MRRFLLIFLMFIALVLGAFMSYMSKNRLLYKPEETPLQNKFFSNSQFGISFQYPQYLGMAILTKKQSPLSGPPQCENFDQAGEVCAQAFTINFSNDKTIEVHGGYECLGCDMNIRSAVGISVLNGTWPQASKVLSNGGIQTFGRDHQSIDACEMGCVYTDEFITAFPLSTSYKFAHVLGRDSGAYQTIVNSFVAK